MPSGLAQVRYVRRGLLIVEEIGDGVGDETITDGLGMVLTGILWGGSSAAVGSSHDASHPTQSGTPPTTKAAR